MATPKECPVCGSATKPIVWGYATIPDVEDAGDAIIGGCVVDVDAAGRVAVAQCERCGTRVDASGAALERTAPTSPDPPVNPFQVGSQGARGRATGAGASGTASGPGGSGASAPAADLAGTDTTQEATMTDPSQTNGWRDRIDPYSAPSGDDVPPPSAPHPDHVEPYASREDALPEGGGARPDRVEPYASRSDEELPPAQREARDRVDPYASRSDDVPERGEDAWKDRIAPYDESPSADDAQADDERSEQGHPEGLADQSEPPRGEQP